jgi:hypothetical protein
MKQIRDVILERQFENEQRQTRNFAMVAQFIAAGPGEKNFAIAGSLLDSLTGAARTTKPANVVKVGKREFDVDRLPSTESIAQAFARGVK